MSERKYVDQTKTTLTDMGLMKCRIVPKNSLLVVCVGSMIGRVAISKSRCGTNQQISSIILSEWYDVDYIYYQLIYLNAEIKLKATNQTTPIINKTEFGNIDLQVPCLAEQLKISSFLSQIDLKLENMAKQIDLMKTWKKNLLIKMFA